MGRIRDHNTPDNLGERISKGMRFYHANKTKHADDCTFNEMLGRFDKEINRAIKNDYPEDCINQLRDNKRAFAQKYNDMPRELTIKEFENQKEEKVA